SLSSRDLIATLAIGVTVPSASTCSGTSFATASATSTETPRAFGAGACATAPCGLQRLRVAAAAPATASRTATPATQVRRLITNQWSGLDTRSRTSLWFQPSPRRHAPARQDSSLSPSPRYLPYLPRRT